ncbi:MAG: hypothetical protein HGA25_04160 [Clostridiales bacterium]|nr:hypothetical protein [Clostridiales bacterium]
MMSINTPTNEFAPVEAPAIGGFEVQKPVSEVASNVVEAINPIAVTVPIAIGKDSSEVASTPITDVPKMTFVKPVIGPDFVNNSGKDEDEALYNKANGLPLAV